MLPLLKHKFKMEEGYDMASVQSELNKAPMQQLGHRYVTLEANEPETKVICFRASSCFRPLYAQQQTKINACTWRKSSKEHHRQLDPVEKDGVRQYSIGETIRNKIIGRKRRQ